VTKSNETKLFDDSAARTVLNPVSATLTAGSKNEIITRITISSGKKERLGWIQQPKVPKSWATVQQRSCQLPNLHQRKHMP